MIPERFPPPRLPLAREWGIVSTTVVQTPYQRKLYPAFFFCFLSLIFPGLATPVYHFLAFLQALYLPPLCLSKIAITYLRAYRNIRNKKIFSECRKYLREEAIAHTKFFLSDTKEEYCYLDRVMLVLEYYRTVFLAHPSK